MTPLFGAQRHSESAENTALGGMVQGEVLSMVMSRTTLDANRLRAPPKSQNRSVFESFVPFGVGFRMRRIGRFVKVSGPLERVLGCERADLLLPGVSGCRICECRMGPVVEKINGLFALPKVMGMILMGEIKRHADEQVGK